MLGYSKYELEGGCKGIKDHDPTHVENASGAANYQDIRQWVVKFVITWLLSM